MQTPPISIARFFVAALLGAVGAVSLQVRGRPGDRLAAELPEPATAWR